MRVNSILVLCTVTFMSAHSFAKTYFNEQKLNLETVEKRQEGLFGDFALAEYLFKLGDVNKDKYLDSNEIYNFYRHHIKFDFDKSAKMSIKLMNIGDSDKDGRLGEIEAILALHKVTNQLNRKRK
ncbi:uncharacterized protein LOC134723420 [Mytilus trossulus]